MVIILNKLFLMATNYPYIKKLSIIIISLFLINICYYLFQKNESNSITIVEAGNINEISEISPNNNETAYSETLNKQPISTNPFISPSLFEAESSSNQPSITSSISPHLRPQKTNKRHTVKKHEVFFGYLRLVGTTVFSSNMQNNKAIIEDLLTSRQKSYAIGSVVPYGAEIIRVHEKGIVLTKDKAIKRLDIAGKIGNLEDIEVLKINGYKKVADNEWLIRPNSLIGSTENIFKLLTEASIRPQISLEGIEGFSFNNIEQDAVYTQLGIAEGDVVTTINGETMDSLAKVYKVYQQIRKESLIRVGLKRQQQEVDLAYHIVAEGPPKYSVKKLLESASIAELFKK